jgi:DNA polymerase-1
VIDPSRSKYQLKTIALERLHVDLGEEDVDSQQYIGKCAQVVRQLMAIESQELKEKDLEKVFSEAELPLIEVLAAMETVGISVNGEFLEAFGNDIKKKIHTLEEQIYNCAGKTFNINSPMQLGNILFEDLGLPFGKKTKRGYSTGADVLEKIRDKHPIVDLVLEYRNVTKLNSTYVEGMKPLIGKDGKIRAHFQQTVTATGRVSCTEPNLQNIPVRQELGRNLRKAFIADKDHILIGADYSQIELRVLAHLSQDDELIEAFNKGEDIHRLTASRVLGIPFDEVTPQERSKAKAVNFGVIYGMSSFGLSEELNITRKEAENYIKDYFDKHKKVKEYMDLQIANCKTKGYSETILGRKRPIHEINASSYIVRQLGERLAMNSPIQGSAADIIKCAMIKVYKSLKDKFPETKLILQVHDELILSAPKKDAEEIKALLKKDMEEAVKLDVRLEAEVNEGETWYDLK